MLSGGGSPEFAVGVLAHTQGMMAGHQGQVDEPADDHNPVRAEAQHVGSTAVDHPQHFGRAPQSFVRGNAPRRLLADFPHAGDRVPRNRGLAEVQAGLGIPALEDLHRLRRRPTERATPLVRAVDDLLATHSAVQRWRVTERGARLAGTVVARKFLVPPGVRAGGGQPQAGQPGSRLPLAVQGRWRRAGGA
jgi:hypothetical protein